MKEIRLSVQREIHRGDKEIRNKKGPIMSIDPFYCGTAVYRAFAFSCGGEYGDDIIYNQLAFWFIKFINCREEMKGREREIQ